MQIQEQKNIACSWAYSTYYIMEFLLMKYTCPCLIADEPCQKNCSCIKPYMSHGCLCCARYGSNEQKKEKANLIVKQMRELKRPNNDTYNW
jgi:hypothetical protein